MSKTRNVRRYKNITGQRFGKIVAVRYSHTTEVGRAAMWVVACDCGNESVVSGNNLRMGKSKSCGCESLKQLEKGWGHNKGIKCPERAGANCHLWRGGVYPKNLAARHTIEYKQWRTSVFERDNYTCQWCKQVGGKLNADHIIPFSADESNRLSLDNGRTLCVDCHRKTDTYGEKAKKYNLNAGILA